MSKISCATHNTFTVRELRDDELQEVSGGSNEVTSIVAPRDINSGHTVGLVAPLHSPL